MKGRKSIFFLAALLMTSIGLQASYDDYFAPDHYLSYDILTATLRTQKISLKDQFIDWTDFSVRNPSKLLNPTVKRHNGIVYDINNPRLHYASYELKSDRDMYIDEKVKVINQFGEFELSAFRIDSLLTPTLKRDFLAFTGNDESINQHALKADHYLCYEIPPIKVDTESGFLRDQFRGRSFDKLIARRLCNPAAKKHNDKVFDIQNDDPFNHLMCFELRHERIWRVVELLNQFGIKKAIAIKDDEICVPTYKIKVPRDCGALQPGDDGMCNGICPDPTDLCLPDSTGKKCSCYAQKTPCKEDVWSDDGMCNGFCADPDEICVPNATDKGCHCFKEQRNCFDTRPDDNGMCNGLCENANEQCIPDTTGQRCRCVPPTIPCKQDSWGDDGMCNGFCANADEICVPNATDKGCHCFKEQRNCFDTRPDDNDMCNGFCPAGEICVINVDQRCVCEPQDLPCGFMTDGTCGGLCPVERPLCRIVPGSNQCGCFRI